MTFDVKCKFSLLDLQNILSEQTTNPTKQTTLFGGQKISHNLAHSAALTVTTMGKPKTKASEEVTLNK